MIFNSRINNTCSDITLSSIVLVILAYNTYLCQNAPFQFFLFRCPGFKNLHLLCTNDRTAFSVHSVSYTLIASGKQ